MDTTSHADLLCKPVLTVEEAGRVLRISRNSAYEAARIGQLPTLRIGRRVLVPTAALLRMLGIDPDGDTPADGGSRSLVHPGTPCEVDR
jgi:excisionase family DNA binding protein